MEGQNRGAFQGAEQAPYAYDNGREASQQRYANESVEGGEGYEGFEGEEGGEGERGIIGDTYRKFRGKPPQKPGQQDENLGSFIFGKLQGAVQDISSEIGKRMDGKNDHGPAQASSSVVGTFHQGDSNRFGSFAAPKNGNDVKWFVDGCGYFWAVSKALEEATHSIWILDWWLSPELYLRRPPSKNEQYRLDRMLQAAAQRGVKINVIVYKEVPQALSLDSAHTKHALEALHPNISVFRHPDHLPDATSLQSSFWSSLQNIELSAKTASNLPQDTIKALYGVNDDVVLFWAHHEKLCLIDGRLAFMGGLDLCYGRWDTNQHPIADCHPANLDDIVFPGQDYNNARIMDFEDVSHWQNNKVDRTKSARMGWSDISVSLRGPLIEDLKLHFTERWNFIYKEKYDVRKDVRYSPLTMGPPSSVTGGQGPPSSQVPPQNQYQSFRPQSQSSGVGGTPPVGASGQYPPPPPVAPSGPQGVDHFPPPPPGPPSGADHFPPPPPGPPPNSQGVEHYPPPPQGPRPGSQGVEHYPPPPPGPPPAGQNVQQFAPPPTSTSQQQSAPPPTAASQQQFAPPPTGASQQNESQYFAPPPTGSSRGINPEFEAQGQESTRGNHSRLERYEQEAEALGGKARGRFEQGMQHIESQYPGVNQARGRFEQGMQHIENRYPGVNQHLSRFGLESHPQSAGQQCQIVRSCSKWSNGGETEHSIQNAYISIIENSQHFVYIENQFFITATSDSQHPVKNKIGAAIVERILRAARAGQKFKIIVIIPAVPGFAGDLRDDSALGTRAIMEYQYNSINRGGHSIMEAVGNAGYNPTEYIRFYNLRNYDRINVSASLQNVEQKSHVNYEDARNEYEQIIELPADNPGTGSRDIANYRAYSQATGDMQKQKELYPGVWDSVSECYMLGGKDIRSVPWENGQVPEIDAFVTEELYIHSKVLIADDRLAIVGSANLNDRSQLGYHDSEIAIIVQDSTPVESFMDGRPYRASKFAATLRRQLFRKHLGLLKPQSMETPDQNYAPAGVPNVYDFDSPEDRAVADPLADTFLAFWNSRAHTNTQVFRKIFRPVPDDSVLTWADYENFYERYFKDADQQATGKEGWTKSKYMWGHVVVEDFPPGDQGLKEVKDLLATVKGTLVEMPLLFLIKEDIAKEGLSLNAFTEEVYT